MAARVLLAYEVTELADDHEPELVSDGFRFWAQRAGTALLSAAILVFFVAVAIVFPFHWHSQPHSRQQERVITVQAAQAAFDLPVLPKLGTNLSSRVSGAAEQLRGRLYGDVEPVAWPDRDQAGALAAGFQQQPVPGFDGAFCGINADPHLCHDLLGELWLMNPSVTVAILCKDGGSNPCELDVERRVWEGSDPTLCRRSPGLLYLWEVHDFMSANPSNELQDDPLCGVAPLLACPLWAAQAWMAYADKWRPKLNAARRNGLRVSSPRFDGDVSGKLADFFAACPECNRQDSPYYVDAIAFDAGLDQRDLQGSASQIKALASELKDTYAGRLVVLANTGSEGARSAAELAEMIDTSGLFDRSNNPLDAVYWLVRPRFFSGELARSVLHDRVEGGSDTGLMLGQVLVDRCSTENTATIVNPIAVK